MRGATNAVPAAGGGLKIIQQGTLNVPAVSAGNPVTHDLPQPVSVIIMQAEPSTSMGTTYYEAFLILPGYTEPSDNKTGNLDITLDSTGTQLIFTRSGMGNSSATDFGYLALG